MSEEVGAVVSFHLKTLRIFSFLFLFSSVFLYFVLYFIIIVILGIKNGLKNSLNFIKFCKKIYKKRLKFIKRMKMNYMVVSLNISWTITRYQK